MSELVPTVDSLGEVSLAGRTRRPRSLCQVIVVEAVSGSKRRARLWWCESRGRRGGPQGSGHARRHGGPTAGAAFLSYPGVNLGPGSDRGRRGGTATGGNIRR